MLFFYLLAAATFSPVVKSIIGYDCGQKFTNYTTFSLIDVEECNIPDPVVNVTNEHIILMQINEFMTTRVFYCRVEIKRTVQYCGMHSHTSTVRGGETI